MTSVTMATPASRKLGNLSSSDSCGLLRRTFDPTGNYVASRLREIFDESSIFPESNYSTEIRKQRRWQSVVHSDYQPIRNWQQVFQKTQKPSTSLRFREDDGKMFMQWKVPSRLTERSDRQSVASMPDDVSAYQAEKIPTPTGSLYKFNSASAMSEKVPGSARPATQVEPSPGRGSASAEVREPSRMTSALGNGILSPSRSAVQSPRKPPTKPSSPQKKMTKAQKKKELFLSYEQHDVPEAEGHWFQGAKDSGRLSLPPATSAQQRAAPRSVQRWIGNATERERQVALDFIKSMSDNTDARTFNEIAQLLKNETEGKGSLPRDDRSPRHLRLLTPQTRSNPTMHQTWHHLPSYGVRDVTHPGAIYVTSNATMPRHFTIHPEWGP